MSFKVVNIVLLVLIALVVLGTSANGLHLAFMSPDRMMDDPGYVASSAIMEVSVDPVLYLVGVFVLILANAMIFSKGNGPQMTKKMYGWGGLALCTLVVIAMLMPALTVPLLDYMDMTKAKVEALGHGFRAIMIIRAVLGVLFVIAGSMAIRSSGSSGSVGN